MNGLPQTTILISRLRHEIAEKLALVNRAFFTQKATHPRIRESKNDSKRQIGTTSPFKIVRTTQARGLYSGGHHEDLKKRKQGTALYAGATIIIVGSLVYAAVPLYRIFCQETGLAGTPITSLGAQGKASGPLDAPLVPVKGAKPIRITFAADTAPNMPWKFSPEQRHVQVIPGQTALVFYSATNTASRDITGVATYSIIPARAAPYFNKIQCFCFEEQHLGAGEQVDMPVFFYLGFQVFQTYSCSYFQ
jgi:cytochrome c oxidase assembly protein subunit 11